MDSQIELIKKRVEILDLVSDYVSLKKSGRNYKGLCPFHNEKTPSFMINPERGIFKCFGCGKSGDIFSFVQEVDSLDFPEALRVLAKRAGVQLKDFQTSPQAKLREKVLTAQQLAAKFYQTILLEHTVGKQALEYLKKRGLTMATIKAWGLGYAPNQWEVVTKALGANGFTNNEIISTGLGVPSDKSPRPYDRFRGRVMFPIKDITGRVVGFSGRILGDGEPKYMNSPDSLIYQKSKILFGMDLAKNSIKKENLAVLVEGNMDVISSHQVGVKNVVAPLGTALTIDQIAVLMRFADTAALSFDTDLAGDSATKRGIELAEDAGLNIRVVHLSGKDPDEVITSSSDSWKEAIKRTTPIYDFFLDSAFSKANASSPEGKRRIAKEIMPILNRITDPILRGHYLKLVAEKLLVEERYLEQALSNLNSPRAETGNSPIQVRQTPSRQIMIEEELIKLVLELNRRPRVIFAEDFTNEKFAKIYKELIKVFPDKKVDGSLTVSVKFDTPTFVSKLPPETVASFDEILLKLRPEEDLDEDIEVKNLIQAATELRRSSLRRLLRQLGLMIKQAQANGEDSELAKLNNKFREFSEKLAHLEAADA